MEKPGRYTPFPYVTAQQAVRDVTHSLNFVMPGTEYFQVVFFPIYPYTSWGNYFTVLFYRWENQHRKVKYLFQDHQAGKLQSQGSNPPC